MTKPKTKPEKTKRERLKDKLISVVTVLKKNKKPPR